MDASFLDAFGPVFLEVVATILAVFAIIMLVSVPQQLRQIDDALKRRNKTRG
ncbi:hypothetical protein [Caballeronia sp. BR00000012568055]|uniref:hypothetical protein n=1 Tax=Caballeronia sp. BR00000012568055 TaxID=2918761 RepID=UPI0023F6BD24|nr:hypothetical protein [Caballeronia sp. BR00000012568055]